MYLFEDRSIANGGQKYGLRFKNESSNSWSFLCFQDQPSGLPKDYFSLAWFSKVAHTGTTIDFSWSIDYSFVWSQVGHLGPGIQFQASQTVPAENLSSRNDITFDYTDNAYLFKGQKNGPAGALTIRQTFAIPNNNAAIGIGMSGQGTFAVQAQANITASFVPTPKYYIAFAQSIQEGQVLNITQLSQVAEIKFPVNNFGATVVLQADNTWDISYSPQQPVQQ